jgi:hypothetical protein
MWKESVQRHFVRQVDDCNLRRPLALISVKQIVVPNCQIEYMSSRDSGRVAVIIFRSWTGVVTKVEPNSAAGHALGKATRGVACTPLQESPCFELLIGGEAAQIDNFSCNRALSPLIGTGTVSMCQRV